MFDTYSEIFAKRGHAYHESMVRFPGARQEEFNEILALADIKSSDYICDIPSGGGYLSEYCTIAPALFLAVDPADQFIAHYKESRYFNGIRSKLEMLAFAPGSIDTIISLAGLHHLPDRNAFYSEVGRVLKPGGTLCIGDVSKDSNVAAFLNIFVDRHNSMGHRGDFFTEEEGDEVARCGFKPVQCYQKNYSWQFDSQEDMVRCCRLMFGLDRASDAETLEGIRQYLGFHIRDGKCLMNWGLMFIKGIKK